MLMGAENQIHVVFQPTQQTPRELIFRVQFTHFEKMQSPQMPQFSEFYSNTNKFEEIGITKSEEEFEVGVLLCKACQNNQLFVKN